MAIFHLSAKIVSRGKGQSAVAKAAYNSREVLINEQTGERHDYRRQDEILFSGIFAPKDAPDWVKDRQKLWSAVEEKDYRKNSQLAREVEIALPHELTDKQRENLIKDFVRENFVRKGMIADVAIHAPSKEGDERNHHAHILLTMREIGPDGFGEKMRQFNSKAQLEQWREQWERLANRHLERFGHTERIDRRTLEAQGIDREATIHLGPKASQIEREGIKTERGDINRNIEAKNQEREQLHAQTSTIDKELERVQAQQAESSQDFLKHEEKAKLERDAKRLEEKQRAPEEAAQKRETRAIKRETEKGIRVVCDKTGKVFDGVTKALSGLLDFFVGAAPERKISPSEYARSAEARKEYQIQQGRAAKRNEALDQMAEQIRQEKSISLSQLMALSAQDIVSLRDKGDAGLMTLISRREEERGLTFEQQLGLKRQR